jgi:hypothetical protein
VSFRVYFVFAGQITTERNVIIGQFVPKRNVSLLFRGELDNRHSDALFTLEEKETYVLRI